ncbi:MAG: tetratricopeptide repeat protein [Bacteroidota bacterium]
MPGPQCSLFFAIASLKPRVTLGLLVFVLYFFSSGFAFQNKTLDAATKGILSKRPKTYKEIDDALASFKRDTVALNAFIRKAEMTSYPAGRSYALNQIGTIYRNRSYLTKAIALHQKALEIAESSNNLEFVVYSLNMLGTVYRRKDAIKTGLDYHQKALEIAEAIELPSVHIKRNINIALNSIGNLYQTLGQYDLAISQFQRALELEGALGNKLGLAINNQNIGDCLEHKGNLEDALKRYKTSLDFNNEINNDFGRVICQNSIAQIHLKQNRPNLALELLEPSLDQITRIGDKFIWSSVLANLGWAYMEIQNYQEAEKFMSKGLNMANEISMPTQIIYAQKLLSDLESRKGNHKKALAYYQQAEEFNQQLKNDRNIRYINDLILRYEAEKKTSQISALAQENELVKLRLRKNQTTILVSALVIGLVGTILFIMYRQYQSNYEKRVMGLEQNMLRSQMNPHFLFNSLNSIKLYIINNDKKNAVHYLNKFSKLVRRILDGSSLKETTLAEELETIELYLNIENIRFSEGIAYSINLEDGIDPEQLKIPSLVLQPFLENAIWHGLSSKEGEKNLWVNVSRKDDIHIIISIIDNGVGRAASEKIKENRVIKRKSVGIDITKERLANFAKDYQYGFSIEIIDLFTDEGNPKGTKVVLEIPTI